MQLNGINIQPKIGSDFAAQYGVSNNINDASTMVNAQSPSAKSYDRSRVTQNTNPEKIAENISKYETAQGNYMKMFHGITK